MGYRGGHCFEGHLLKDLLSTPASDGRMDSRVGTEEQVSERFRSYTSTTNRGGVFVYQLFFSVQKVGSRFCCEIVNFFGRRKNEYWQFVRRR